MIVAQEAMSVTRQNPDLVFVILFCLLCPTAQAGEFNYHTPYLGERAVGMGGASTAVADDASASYYNPAGLAQSRSTSLSLSATVVQFRMQEVDDFLGPDGFSQWSLNIIAASWSWATDLWGGRFALSMYVPNQVDFELDKRIVTDLPVDSKHLLGAHLVRKSSTETYLGGPSMAWAVGQKWALGFSLFGNYTTFSLLQDDTFLFDDGSMTQVIDSESGGTVGIRNHIGVLYQPTPNLHFGLNLRLGFHALEWGDWRRLRFESADGLFFERTVENEHLGVRDPPERDDDVELKDVQGVALGVAWQLTPDLLLAVDVSLWSPVEFQRMNRIVKKEPTWNVALGGEWRIYPNWPFRFGLFTNFSSAPDIDTAALADLDPNTDGRLDLPPGKVDFYGGSLSIGHLTTSSTMDVALVAMVGVGDHVELLGTGPIVYDILDWSISLTISGSYIFEDDSELEAKRHGDELREQEDQMRRKIREEPSPWDEQKQPAQGDNEWKTVDEPNRSEAQPKASDGEPPAENVWQEVESHDQD